MKKFFAIMLLAVMLIFCNSQNVTAQAQNFNFDSQLIKLTSGAEFEAIVDSDIDFLALRSGPSTNSRILIRIPPGAYIKVYARGELYRPGQGGYGFQPVSYRGVSGYAYDRYFTLVSVRTY